MIFPRTLLLLALFAAPAWAAAALAATPIEQAEAAIKAGQFAQADDLLAPLAERRHPDAAVLYNLSVVRLAQKRTEEAVDLAERAVKADRSKQEYYLQLGNACNARIGEVGPMEANELAITMRKTYERILEIDPNSIPALNGLIFFYEHAPELVGGNPRKALEIAARLSKVDEYQGEIALGRLAAGAKDLAGALAHYDAAVKLKPDDLATKTASGWVLAQLGRTAEARDRFEAVLKIDPNFPPAKLGMVQTAPVAH